MFRKRRFRRIYKQKFKKSMTAEEKKEAKEVIDTLRDSNVFIRGFFDDWDTIKERLKFTDDNYEDVLAEGKALANQLRKEGYVVKQRTSWSPFGRGPSGVTGFVEIVAARKK
jgi:hypothetical protein